MTMKVFSRTILVASCLGFGLLALGACSPEVGSKEWCQDMDKKDKGNWTANEAAEYLKSCLL
jgi:hypothetical protein